MPRAQQPTELRLSAVVTRADGRVEVLGDLAYWHRNPLRRAWYVVCRRLAGSLPSRLARRS